MCNARKVICARVLRLLHRVTGSMGRRLVAGNRQAHSSSAWSWFTRVESGCERPSIRVVCRGI